MKTKTKHSPLPWEVKKMGSTHTIREKDGYLIATVWDHNSNLQEGDASFIIRACNNHYELLEACKVASDYFFSKNLADTANTVKEIINQAISNTERER